MSTAENSLWPNGADPAPAFCGEADRAAVLAAYGFEAVMDDSELRAIVQFAARLCETPSSLVSIVGPEDQKFLAREGYDGPEPPVSESFCAYAMLTGALMTVADAKCDSRFAGNPLVTAPNGIRFYAGMPLISSEGAPLGSLCVIDPVARPGGLTALQREGFAVLAQAVMRRLETRRAILQADARQTSSTQALREIANLVPAIIWSSDAEGNFDYYNSRWDEVTALPRPKVQEDWLKVVHPEDGITVGKAWTASMRGGKPFESEFRLRQADGEWRWTMSRALPFRGPEGDVRRWYGTLTDIDDTRRQSENRELLARELSHRIKNIFAVVAGLISIRARQNETARPFADELIGAIRALGRAHDFVRPVDGAKGDSLHGLLAELMAPYADAGGERVRIEGGDCEIGPRAATPLGLVFHELATNSAKYGALSVEGGHVAIEIDCPDEEATTRVHWREHGGPAAADTGLPGFGTRLITMAVEGQLGGKIVRRYGEAGLEVDLEMQSSAIRS